MIRILYIIDDLMIGGAEKILLDVASGLDRSTFDCDVLTLFSTDGMAEAFRARGVRCETLGVTKAGTIECLAKLRGRIRTGRYDIVQLIRPVSRITGAMALIGLDKPLLITRYDSMISTERWKYRVLEKLPIRQADAIMTPSRAVMNELSSLFNVSSARTVVTYNGIHHAPGTHGGVAAIPPTIGTIGNLSWKKGYEHGLQAIRLVQERFPEVRYEIVGRHNDDVHIQKWIAEMKLERTVRLLGQQADVADHLRRWSIYFQPSMTEGFGLAVLEAMSYGKPVVASRSGGIPELIHHGETGLMVTPGNAGEMAAALQSLLENPSLARTLGAAAMNVARSTFSAAKMVAEHEQLYRDLMNGNHRINQ